MAAFLVTGNPGSGKTTLAGLQEVFNEHSDPVFVCGIARNIRDVLDLFDCVLLLRIDADTQEERLRVYDLRSPSSARNDAVAAVADAILQLVSRYIPRGRDAAGC